MSTQDENLDTCGCCEGLKSLTPVSVKNRPGLAAIAYRAGTHGSFKVTMQSQLSAQRPLQPLTTRDDNDPAIALVDGWATVADVLTFYQERIANEGYLRTATERRSILELARLIGYELNAGVAASTYLAFAIEQAQTSPATTDAASAVGQTPSSPTKAKIGAGKKAQSVPGQDELPQVFETIEEIEARGEWNELKPQSKVMKIPGAEAKEIFLKGILTRLKLGDGLLMIGADPDSNEAPDRWDFRRINKVETDKEGDFTRVAWDEPLKRRTFPCKVLPAGKDFQVFAMRRRAFLFGHNAPDWRVMPASVKDEFRTCGLFGEYFDNSDFTGLKRERTDPKIDFDWGAGQPHPDISSDTFSVRWMGFIKPERSGNYNFYTPTDGGVKLWLDNELIIDQWNNDDDAEYNAGPFWLEAAELHAVRLEYRKNAHNAKIILKWSGPGIPKAVIAPYYLHPLYPPGNYDDWPQGFNIAAISGDPYADPITKIYLDSLYPQIVEDSWLVLVAPGQELCQEVYKVTGTVESSRKDFTLTAKTTAVTLGGNNLDRIREKFNNKVRETVVFAESEELEIAEEPLTESVAGSSIVLYRLLPDLEEKRSIIVSGKPIRVRLSASAEEVEFRSTEGSQTVQLSPEDTFVVMEAPTEQEKGQYVWTLKDKNGFIGKVIAEANEMDTIPARKEDKIVSEFNIIDTVERDSDPTVINLAQNLKNRFDRSTVVIYANVAKATHGESKAEVLGGGDGSQEFQEFVLKQNPLTFVAASTPKGSETTLKVRVNDVLWKEVSAFFGHGPDERIYITRLNDDGKTRVIFGDGRTGARLPTGQENVRAEYRQGIGLSGLMKAGQISQLMTRPLGVKGVVNPIAATGADDPEKLDRARQNAPLTVLTLDRIVSLQDYEDFAGAFAGIGKAQATMLRNGEQKIVHITVSAAGGGPAQEGLREKLVEGINAARHVDHQVVVDSYEPLKFNVKALVRVDSSLIVENVMNDLLKAVKEAFCFDRRNFGQAVTKSEVMAVIQRVPGVIALDLEYLCFSSDVAGTPPYLEALRARWDDQNTSIEAAQLLTVNTIGIVLGEMKV